VECRPRDCDTADGDGIQHCDWGKTASATHLNGNIANDRFLSSRAELVSERPPIGSRGGTKRLAGGFVIDFDDDPVNLEPEVLTIGVKPVVVRNRRLDIGDHLNAVCRSQTKLRERSPLGSV
jgi:hypothetical protein